MIDEPQMSDGECFQILKRNFRALSRLRERYYNNGLYGKKWSNDFSSNFFFFFSFFSTTALPTEHFIQNDLLKCVILTSDVSLIVKRDTRSKISDRKRERC